MLVLLADMDVPLNRTQIAVTQDGSQRGDTTASLRHAHGETMPAIVQDEHQARLSQAIVMGVLAVRYVSVARLPMEEPKATRWPAQ